MFIVITEQIFVNSFVWN